MGIFPNGIALGPLVLVQTKKFERGKERDPSLGPKSSSNCSAKHQRIQAYIESYTKKITRHIVEKFEIGSHGIRGSAGSEHMGKGE